ncbi:hypothetical protein, partial [Escherichia coli]|uniref:hypothetical protein n=1 Tax=Escherichia coli TaxID=562 RepID=UPI0020B8C292
PSISDGRLSYQFSSDGYIRRSVYAYTSHIEIFAKKVHGKSFFSTNPGYKYSSAPQYSTALNLSPPPCTSDNGLKSLRPLATTLLNKENLA